MPVASRPACNTADRLHDWRVSVLGVDFCGKCGLVGRFDQTPRVQAPGSKARTQDSRPRDRSPAWEGRVRACWSRDGEGCFYCRRPMSLSHARLDHFIPRSKGGPDALENRRVACWACDNAQADKMPGEFMPGVFEAPAA